MSVSARVDYPPIKPITLGLHLRLLIADMRRARVAMAIEDHINAQCVMCGKDDCERKELRIRQ